MRINANYNGLARIIAVVFLASLIGCKSNRPTVTKNRVVKDSVSVTTSIVPRDTIVVVPRDSVNVRVSLKELGIEPTVATSKSGDVKATIRRIEDTIIVDCDVKELEMKLQLLDKEIEKLKSTKIVDTETKYVPERYVPWWVKILAWAGGIAIVYFALKTVIKSFKPF